jgi:hypothetical protein
VRTWSVPSAQPLTRVPVFVKHTRVTAVLPEPQIATAPSCWMSEPPGAGGIVMAAREKTVFAA